MQALNIAPRLTQFIKVQSKHIDLPGKEDLSIALPPHSEVLHLTAIVQSALVQVIQGRDTIVLLLGQYDPTEPV